MGEEITKATQEMNDNIATLTTDVTSLKTNASNVSQLALDYTGFKNELQSTLENVITYINSQNTSNTKTQSEIEQKLTAYKKLLVDYKSKINKLKKGDIDALSQEIDLIKKRLTEEPALKIKRTELLQKATQLLNKTNNGGPPPNNENDQNDQDAVALLEQQKAAVNKKQQQKTAQPSNMRPLAKPDRIGSNNGVPKGLDRNVPGAPLNKGGSRKRRRSKKTKKTRRR